MLLCNEEGISDIESVDLLASAITSYSALNEQDRLQILSLDGPGSAADNPIVLFIIKDLPLMACGNASLSPIPDPADTSKLPGPFSLIPSRFHHKRHVMFIAFSPDGSRIASCSMDYTICIWSVSTGTLLTPNPIRTHSSALAMAFSPDGIQIVSCFPVHPYISGVQTMPSWFPTWALV